MIELKFAKSEEADLCLSFIEDAKIFQRAQGIIQWTEDYPNIETVLRDIEKARGYVITDDSIPFGYVCVDFEGEKSYDRVDGKWLTDGRYGVIHRLAFGKASRGKGATKAVFALIRDLCREKDAVSIRVDTGSENKLVQHIFEREGFRQVGTLTWPGQLNYVYEFIL